MWCGTYVPSKTQVIDFGKSTERTIVQPGTLSPRQTGQATALYANTDFAKSPAEIVPLPEKYRNVAEENIAELLEDAAILEEEVNKGEITLQEALAELKLIKAEEAPVPTTIDIWHGAGSTSGRFKSLSNLAIRPFVVDLSKLS